VTIVAVVVVTANHYYLDVAAGVVVMALGVLIAYRRTFRSSTSVSAVIGLLLAAAILIWLPRAATVPLVLDVALAAAVAVVARRGPSASVVTESEPELVHNFG
jgi:hypothetical protein